MEPNHQTCAWPADVKPPRDAFVYDLVYKPRNTKLIGIARAHGLRAAHGMGMLVEQGAIAFELWTGVPAARVSRIMHSAIMCDYAATSR